MIGLLRSLEPRELRQLLRALDPTIDLETLGDDELVEELIEVLKRELEARQREDLGQLLRRRLVEVAVEQFAVVESADLLSDLELAAALTDFVLESIDDAEGQREFETFMRTKARRERLDWLVAAHKARALATDEAFDRTEARKQAEEVGGGSIPAHTATADAILADLGALAPRKRSGARTAAAASGGAALGASAGAAVGVTGATASALTATGVAGAAALAAPLAALAGGLYMAGRSRRQAAKDAVEDAERSRPNRARRSRIVQSVVTLSVFAVAASTATEG